jgi:hypothetical protein
VRRLRAIAALLACAAPAAGWGAHVTDKMAVGLYASPKDESPQRVLISGEPLEIVDRSGPLCRVTLGDGDTGWLECRYVTDEKPARVMLVEAQARIGSLWQEIEGLKGRLAAKQRRIEELERHLEAAEGLFAAGSAEAPTAPRPGREEPGPPAREPAGPGRTGAVSAALLGAVGGASVAAGLVWRSRRRSGRLRV